MYNRCLSFVLYLASIKCNPPLCPERDAINGTEFQPHPLHSLIQSQQFPYIVRILCPHRHTSRNLLPQTAKGGKGIEWSPKLGKDKHDIQQKRAVWTTQLNGVLKHRLYKTLDAQTQTYKPPTSNKEYKNMDIA